MLNRKVLITGGAGFIGSHMTDVLIDKGYDVVIADNYSNKNSGYKNTEAQYVCVDILSNEFEELFKINNFDICIHLAANASVAISNKEPEYDANQNIIGTIRVIELCKKYNIGKIIVSSSAAVYGNPEYLPIDEKHPTKVISNYGLSKLTMEKYVELSGLNYIIFRFANVYGERQTSHGEAGVISIFDNAMRNNEDIYIDGDGEQTRDFVYVKDIVNVVYECIEQDIKNTILNVSTNSAISINMLFNTMSNIYGYNKKAIYREHRKGDIKNSILDNSKLTKTIKYTDFISYSIGLRKLFANDIVLINGTEVI